MILSEDQIDRLFPFHFMWDADFQVSRCGKSLEHLWPGLLGTPASSRIRMVRPAKDFSPAVCRQLPDTLVLLEHLAYPGVLLRGQLVSNSDGTGLFAGTICLRELRDLERLGLKLGHFAHHDPTLELITWAQVHESAIQDLRANNAELRRLKHALTRSELESRRLALVARTTDKGVAILSASFELEWVNEAFETMTGWALEEIKGMRPSKLFQGLGTDAKTSRHISLALRRGLKVKEQLLNYRKDGGAFHARLEISPIQDGQGTVIQFISIQEDITVSVQRELLLRLEAEVHFLISLAEHASDPLGNLQERFSLILQAEFSSWTPVESASLAHTRTWTLEGDVSTMNPLPPSTGQTPAPSAAGTPPGQGCPGSGPSSTGQLVLPVIKSGKEVGALSFGGLNVLPFESELQPQFLNLGVQIGLLLERYDSEGELRIQRSLLTIAQRFAGTFTFRLNTQTMGITWGPDHHLLIDSNQKQAPRDLDELCGLLDDRSQQCFRRHLSQFLKSQQSVDFPLVLRFPGQGSKDLRLLLSHCETHAGSTELHAVVQDVTIFLAKQRMHEKAEAIANLGSWSLDPVSGKMTWSQELSRILGLSPTSAQPTYRNWRRLVHEEDADTFHAAICKIQKNGGRTSFEHRIIRPDGSVRYLRCDAESTVLHQSAYDIAGTQHDITEMVLARQSLLLTEQRWHLAIENSGLGVWDWDVVSGNVVVSSPIYEMLGYRADEWPPHFSTWESKVHPADIAATKRELEASLSGRNLQYRCECRLLCRDGSWKWVRTVGKVVRRDAKGNPLRMIGTHIDVDLEHREADALGRRASLIQELQKAHHLFYSDQRTKEAFQALLNIALRHTGSEYGFVGEVLTDDSEVPSLRSLAITDISWDDASREFIRKAEATGLRFENLNTLFGAAMRTGEAVIANNPRSDPRSGGLPPGHPSLRSFLGVPVFNGLDLVGLIGLANRPGGYTQELLSELDPYTASLSSMIVRMRERQKQADVELRLRLALAEAERANRAKSDFLAVVSHEIRTPLNGILGMAELLCNSSLSDDQRQQLEAVRQSGNALVMIIDDILDFAKIEANAIEIRDEPVDLVAMLDSITDLLGRQALLKGLNFVTILHPNTPGRLMGDTGRIRQVLVNLVGNALKFTAEGSVMIRVEKKNSWLDFRVIDTGRGISTKDSRSIFEPFTQVDASESRNHGGTGLGLAICKRLVGLMNGRIGMTSRRGRGSTFWFRIPFRAESTLEPSTPARNALNRFAWVADPSPEVREALQSACQRAGCSVRVFADARNLIRSLRDITKPCDFLLIDGCWLSSAQEQSLASALRSREPFDCRVFVTRSVSDEIKFSRPDWQFLPRPWRISAIEAICRDSTPFGSSTPESRPGALNLRVLVAEDNDINSSVLMTMLELLGCQGTRVSDGAKAVEMFRNGDFDVILMDCQMPLVDGYEATREIRQLEMRRAPATRTRIIAVTANAFVEHRRRCLEAGMDDHLPKPFTLEKLRSVLLSEGIIKTVPPAAESPVLVSAEFEGLIQMVGPQDAKQLGERWLLDSEQSAIQMRSAVDSADWVSIAKHAHSIAGTSGLFGLVELVRQAKRIEAEVRDTHYLSPDSLRTFTDVLAKSRVALNERLLELKRSI